MTLADMRWEAGCGDRLKPRLAVHDCRCKLRTELRKKGRVVVRKEIVKKITSAREGFEQEKVEMQAVFVTYGVFEGEARESGVSRTVISKHGKKANCRSPEAQLPSSPCCPPPMVRGYMTSVRSELPTERSAREPDLRPRRRLNARDGSSMRANYQEGRLGRV